MTVRAAIQQFQIFESLFLESYKYTSQQLLIGNRVSLQAVRNHIVNILNEYNISIQIIQILNQCTMTTRTEQQLAILIAERLVFHIGSNCISTWLLLRETDMIIDTVLGCVFGSFTVYQFLEQFTMFSRNSKMYKYITRFASCIQRTFHQMFLQRSAYTISITMELQ